MSHSKPRRAFEQGHIRKLLVIADKTPEVEAALYFAACRVNRTGGKLVFLYVIQPQEFQHWMGVKDVQIGEETQKAKALFRLFRRKLANAELARVNCEELIVEGNITDEIHAHIEQDEDIGVLVLGAAVDNKGPGPLVSSLAAGKAAGSFPIPIIIVPGHLTLNEVKTLA
ncbi:MAG: universal stress protein [Hyphomicrobiaceae bacterium]|nr:universal stress protein [Hyphomicrobiaceae bacterium]